MLHPDPVNVFTHSTPKKLQSNFSALFFQSLRSYVDDLSACRLLALNCFPQVFSLFQTRVLKLNSMSFQFKAFFLCFTDQMSSQSTGRRFSHRFATDRSSSCVIFSPVTLGLRLQLSWFSSVLHCFMVYNLTWSTRDNQSLNEMASIFCSLQLKRLIS